MALCYPRTRTKILSLSLFLMTWATFVSSQKEEGTLRVSFDQTGAGQLAASFSGMQKHPVTEEEIKAFDLTDEGNACGEKIAKYLLGVVPTRCLFGHNKTESDTFTHFFKNGWIIPTAEYSVENVTVVGRERKNVVAFFERVEQTSNFRAYKRVFANKKFSNSVTHKNKYGNTLGAMNQVQVSVPGFAQSGAAFQYVHNWGTEETKSSDDVIELGGDVFIVLEPYTTVLINISSYQEFWTFEVHFLVELKGHVIADFEDELEEHHFWNFPVASITDGPRRLVEIVSLNRIESSRTQLSLA